MFSRRLLSLLLLLMCNSCRADSEYKNEYYDRANALYEQIVASPKTLGPFEQLLVDTRSPDEWRRYYAIGYLGLLGSRNIVEPAQRKQIIEVLCKLLADEKSEHRRELVVAIRDMGSEAVIAALSDLLKLVEARKEHDFNWFAAEALGKIRSKPEAAKALAVLLRVACEPKSSPYPPGTPELRIEAASALLELIETNALPAREALLQLKAHLPSPKLAEKIEALLKIAPNNAPPP
jgi:hypothetical protein